jgi:vitamin B12 transporter
MKQTNNARLYGAVIISPFLLSSVFAGENILLNDAVVTATRTPQPREAVIADVSVIDADEIERAGQHTLVEILQSQPGIEITNSGGAGSVSGIFMRGTNTSQVVVLVDGMRIGSATAGITAFENLPTSQIDRIEILRGPATSLYGQDAIGGVIQIFTKKGADGAIKFNANLGYGTYDTVRADAGVSGSVADTRFALNVSSLNTNGFSAIKTNNKDYNDRDAYRNLAFTGNISHQIVVGHEIGFQFLHSDGTTHIDNRFNSNNFDSLSKATQYSYALFCKNQFTENWQSVFRVGEGVDDSVSQFSATSSAKFKTKQKQLSWQNDIRMPTGTLTLLYDRLQQKVITDVPFAETKRNTDGFMVGYLANLSAHSIQANLRIDHSALFGTQLTGGVGYGYMINPNWRITASYAKAFKAPTFNDQYYVDQFGAFNNPNVRPEKSENFEGSLRYADNLREVSITAYSNKINDLIALDSNFLAANVNAKIQGVTFVVNQSWNNWLLKSNIDIQSPKDDDTNSLLSRRANRHASANASYTLGDWRFGAEAVASSFRYDKPNNTGKLAGYALLNASVDYQFSKDWTVQARANNILDKNYALALEGGEAYNTPGANLFVNIRYQP